MKKAGFFALLALFMLIPPCIAETDVKADHIIMKSLVDKGDRTIQTLSLYSVSGGEFEISINGARGVKLGQESISIKPGELGSIDVIFDSSSLEEGVSVGSIVVSDKKVLSVIPVIFEVQSKNSIYSIDLEIPPGYSDISKGGNLMVQITAWNSKSTSIITTNASFDYAIYGIDGEMISTISEKANIPGTSSFTKSFQISNGFIDGEYVLAAILKGDNGQKVVSSGLFSVHSKEYSFGSGLSKKISVLFVVAMFLLLLGSTISFIIIIRGRDKIIREIKEYNSWEKKRIAENKS